MQLGHEKASLISGSNVPIGLCIRVSGLERFRCILLYEHVMVMAHHLSLVLSGACRMKQNFAPFALFSGFDRYSPSSAIALCRCCNVYTHSPYYQS